MAAYTLITSGGGFALSGTPTSTRAFRRFSATSSVVALAASQVRASASRQLPASVGLISFAGSSTPLRSARQITGGGASFTVATAAATPRAGRKLAASFRTYGLTGSPLAFGTGYSLPFAPLSFSLSGGTLAFKVNAYVLSAESGSFACAITDSQLKATAGIAIGTGLYASSSQGEAALYGGSEPTLPSFLRPYYVKFNSISKSRDFGAVSILIADISGRIGTQAGANTLYFKVELVRDLDLRVVKNATGSTTDRFVRVGILDSERRPVPMTPRGYGYLNDIHNTAVDESLARLPAGIYYITVSSDQWQAVDFAATIFVGSYALLGGTSSGFLFATGRIPLIKPTGVLLGSAPLNLTLLNPDFFKGLLSSPTSFGPQAEFLTPGTYAWTAPAGVTSVSAVCVGGGGGGGNAWANAAGSGGGLGWKNNIPVIPGQSYTVVVGAAGQRSGLTAGGNSYFIDLSTVAGYGGGNASSAADTNGPNKNGYGGGWVGDGGGAGGQATNWTGGGGAGGYSGQGGNSGANSTGGGGGGGLAYSSTYGVGSGGGTGIYGEGASGLTGRSRDGTLWSGSAVNGFGGSGGSTATGLSGTTTGTGGRQGETASYGQPYISAIVGGFPGGGGGGPGSSYGGGNGGSGAVRLIWGAGRAYPSTQTSDQVIPAQTQVGGFAFPSLTLTIMRGVAIGSMFLDGRLKQTWRITGVLTAGDQSYGTLTSGTPYGGGYGY